MVLCQEVAQACAHEYGQVGCGQSHFGRGGGSGITEGTSGTTGTNRPSAGLLTLNQNNP